MSVSPASQLGPVMVPTGDIVTSQCVLLLPSGLLVSSRDRAVYGAQLLAGWTSASSTTRSAVVNGAHMSPARTPSLLSMSSPWCWLRSGWWQSWLMATCRVILSPWLFGASSRIDDLSWVIFTFHNHSLRSSACLFFRLPYLWSSSVSPGS